ncbi:MAG: hypothetical protein Aurels2KO_42860 [Aureliella sp.]
MPELNILKDAYGKAAALGEEICQFLESAPMPAIDDSISSSDQIAAVRALIKPWRGSQVESALWLVVGELDRSHSVSQNDPSAVGSFWHGIMHRREGDFSNAKYWFRRVGSHDVHPQLAEQIASYSGFSSEFPLKKLTDSSTLAFDLVDCCQSAASSKPQWKEDLALICWWEWQMLLQHCL